VAEYTGQPIVSEDAVVALVRLFFMQQSPTRNSLNRLFLLLSGHKTTRQLLLNCLADALLPFLGSPAKHPEFAGSRLLGYYHGFPYSVVPPSRKHPPLIVAKRIIEVLSHLVKNNTAVAEFLVEPLEQQQQQQQQEKPGAEEKKSPSMKAEPTTPTVKVLHQPQQQQQKGKPQHMFGLLLDLLGNPDFQKKNAPIEQVLYVLSLAVKTLAQSKKEEKEEEKEKKKNPANADSDSTDAMATTTTTTTSSSEKEGEAVLKIDLSSRQLEKLTEVLTLPVCSEQAFQHAEVVIEHLARDPMNRELLLANLVTAAQRLSSVVQSHLEYLNRELTKATTHPVTVLSILFSSSQAELNLLRVLKTIVALTKSEALTASLNLEAMWGTFEFALDFLTKLSSHKPTSAVASTLAPLVPIVEAFFVVHSIAPVVSSFTKGMEATASTSSIITTTTTTTTTLEEGVETSAAVPRVVRFCEKHRKLLNDLVKQNPSILEGSLSSLLQVPVFLDFDNKRAYFRSLIAKQRADANYGEVRLNVRRTQVFEDSFNQLRARHAEDLRGRLTVHIIGEEGVDAGGVSREWYTILAREMFNPNYGLFLPAADGAFQPNKNSGINLDHLEYFKFIGRVIGKSLHDGQLLDAHFTRSFYKHILGMKVTPHDMEAIDPTYYKSLQWLFETDVTDMDLTFVLPVEEFGAMKTIELKPDGAFLPNNSFSVFFFFFVGCLF
jgi:E3 ubiquitin-protein ligase HUWE1